MSLFSEALIGRCADGPMAGELLTGICETIRIPVRPHRGSDGTTQFDCVIYRWSDGQWYSQVH